MSLSWEVSLFIYYFLLKYNCFTVLFSVSRHCTTKWISYYVCACGLGRFSRVRLCNFMDGSPPGSSVHGILQARILEWAAMPSCRGSSQTTDGTWVSCTAGRFFTQWDTWEAPALCTHIYIYMGEGNGNPFQYSCLENSVDRGAWWAAIHGVAQGQTLLKWLSSSNIHIYLLPLGLPPTTTPIPSI